MAISRPDRYASNTSSWRRLDDKYSAHTHELLQILMWNLGKLKDGVINLLFQIHN